MSDIARCPGRHYTEHDGTHTDPDCLTCARMAAPDAVQSWGVIPPVLIAFECEFRIPTQEQP